MSPTCHFQSLYLSPFFKQVTCVSPNVYGPPVTLSPPFTPWVPPPASIVLVLALVVARVDDRPTLRLGTDGSRL